MAVIGYQANSPFGQLVAEVVADFKDIQAKLPRIYQMANDLTGGGATPANLEGSPQFGVTTGQGAAFYSALQALNAAAFTTPASWAPVQATIDLDQGA